MSDVNDFSINAGSYTLLNTDHSKSILNGTKYNIPVYQRPYSWGEEQVRKFIGDLLTSYFGAGEGSEYEPEPMFIGTMQLAVKTEDINGKQNIIDGQQRLTTFLVLFKVLKWIFSTSEEVNGLKTNWLYTKVNGGKQQDLLDEFIKLDQLLDANLEETDDSLSLYIKNAILIQDILNEKMQECSEEEKEFSVSHFIKYLFEKVYFVVIETRAGLSKTIKIFDTINNAGLDLAAGDIFKLRMYEYLNSEGRDETVFGEINEVYGLIDEMNRERSKKVADISHILSIYQYILIAKNNLSNELYVYATSTFYDRLFETIFNINKWEHFPAVLEEEISLSELKELIKIRFEWEDKWVSGRFGSAENAGLMHLWWWSRYGRYWELIFVFLYSIRHKEDRYTALFKFNKLLIRLYLIYSIYYMKSVNEIKSKFNSGLIKVMLDGTKSEDHVFEYIEKKMQELRNGKNVYLTVDKFKNFISGDVFNNAKQKNLLCRTSALLEEEYTAISEEKIKKIREKLFEDRIDIEHIQSRKDENKSIREKIVEEWGDLLNSLGNLVVLEQRINRKINNRTEQKLPGYRESQYQIVKQLISDYECTEPEWNIKKCEKRRETEIKI